MPRTKIAKEKENFDGIESSSEAHYPYGTSLSFDDDLVDTLKLDDLDVGDVVEVTALAKVTMKSEHDSERNSSKSVSIQLTEVEIYPEKSEPDRASELYPDK